LERQLILEDGETRCWVIKAAFAHLDFEEWHESIPWQQNPIRMFGKEFLEPRLTAWMGPAYRYASIQWDAQPLSESVKHLLEEIHGLTHPPDQLNACLFNLYRNGSDSMGWHRDNEPEIDSRCIVSVSLGASRDFLIRDRKTLEKWNIRLDHGDLLVMENLQTNYEHALPKRLRSDAPRLNMTFRRILSIPAN